jgi:hypothetical protein
LSARRNVVVLAVITALGWLTRPDAVIAYVLLYVHWLVKERKTAIQTLVLAIAFTSPWLIWATVYFGNIIPQSILAKSIMANNPAGYAFFFLATFFATGTLGPYVNIGPLLPLLIIVMVSAGVGVYRICKYLPDLLAIVMVPLSYALIMGIANAPMSSAWYYLPLIPGAIILAMSVPGLAQGISEKLTMTMIVGLAFFFIAIPAVLIKFHPGWTLSNAGVKAYFEACNAIRNELTPGQVVLAPDIGVLGWCLDDARILDPVGLVSPEAILPRYTQSSGGFISLQLIMDKRPDYIISLDQYLSPQTLNNPAFNDQYRLVWQAPVNKGDAVQTLFIFSR